MATAHQFIPEPTPHFDHAWLEAAVAEMRDRQARIAASAEPAWIKRDAMSYAANIWSLAIDCLVELDGDEPETNNPQAELAEVMDDACLSISQAIERRLSDAMILRLAAGQRAYVRGVGR